MVSLSYWYSIFCCWCWIKVLSYRAQCGGISWTGASCCQTGNSCVFVNSYYYQCQTATATSSGVSHQFFVITVITFSSIIDAIYEDSCDKREHYNIYEHNENINWAIYIYHNHCGFDYKVSSLPKNLVLFQAQCLKILFDSIMILFCLL
jgi:hypothetical protein